MTAFSQKGEKQTFGLCHEKIGFLKKPSFAVVALEPLLEKLAVFDIPDQIYN